MHFMGLVLIERPTQEQLSAAMAPFEEKEWDWYRPGGRWDGWLQGPEEMKRRETDNGFNFSDANQRIDLNCCKVSDLPPDKRDPYFFVAEEKWVARERWDDEAPCKWSPNIKGALVDVPDHTAQFEAALAAHPDWWVVVVDAHN